MQIFYGLTDTYIDVTDEAYRFCCDGRRIRLPRDDRVRASVFTDPLVGVEKNIAVFRSTEGRHTCTVYPAGTPAALTLSAFERLRYVAPPPVTVAAGIPVAEAIDAVHRQLTFIGGSLADEGPEQTMVLRYLDPAAKVLEIGSNIGRNTLMISAVLGDSADLVTMECSSDSVDLLWCNRDANGFRFAIEPAALSRRRLMQRGWVTKPGDELEAGCTWVPTITYPALRAKYPIAFDTLVADCEGALYYILLDDPAVLDGINTVILEADYCLAEHKYSVEAEFARRGLRRIHSEPLDVDWAHHFPAEIADSFFEVWTKG